MTKKKRKLISNIITAILSAILAFLIVCMGIYIIRRRNSPQPTVLGYSVATVATGSMEPTIHVKSLIVIHTQKDYMVNDIITYISNSGRSSVTHRLIEIHDNGKYVTKGDANNAADDEINKSQVVGRVVLVIPNFPIVVSIVAVFMIAAVLIGFFPERKKPEKEPLEDEKSS